MFARLLVWLIRRRPDRDRRDIFDWLAGPQPTEDKIDHASNDAAPEPMVGWSDAPAPEEQVPAVHG